MVTNYIFAVYITSLISSRRYL